MNYNDQARVRNKIRIDYGGLSPYPRPKINVMNGIAASITPAADKIDQPTPMPAILRGNPNEVRPRSSPSSPSSASGAKYSSNSSTAVGKSCATATANRGPTVSRPVTGSMVSPAVRRPTISRRPAY